MIASVRSTTGRVLRACYRTAMRNNALLVHDIDVSRRHGAPGPGDRELRVLALRQAIQWRERAAAVENGRTL